MMHMDDILVRHPPLGFYRWDGDGFNDASDVFREAALAVIPADDLGFSEIYYAPTEDKLDVALQENAKFAARIKKFRHKNFWFGCIYDYH